MKGFVDYYKVLGVEREATLDEIKQAYRGLALQHHPDKSQSEMGRVRFLEITRAYEVLKEESSRRKYNLSYDRQFSSNNQQDSYATLQRVRAKRSSRYSRSQYSQRMRYRGSASSNATDGDQPFSYTTKREKKRYNSYSASYASQVISDYERTLKAYGKVTFVLRIFIGLIMAYCSFLLLDKGLAHKGEPQEITKILERKNRDGYINGLKVVTAHATFYCDNRYERPLLKEKEVKIARTPWRGLITGVYVNDKGADQKVKLKREQFGSSFYSIWLVMIGGLLCFVFREDPERNFKLCTGTIVLALVIYFSVFYI